MFFRPPWETWQLKFRRVEIGEDRLGAEASSVSGKEGKKEKEGKGFRDVTRACWDVSPTARASTCVNRRPLEVTVHVNMAEAAAAGPLSQTDRISTEQKKRRRKKKNGKTTGQYPRKVEARGRLSPGGVGTAARRRGVDDRGCQDKIDPPFKAGH